MTTLLKLQCLAGFNDLILVLVFCLVLLLPLDGHFGLLENGIVLPGSELLFWILFVGIRSSFVMRHAASALRLVLSSVLLLPSKPNTCTENFFTLPKPQKRQ